MIDRAGRPAKSCTATLIVRGSLRRAADWQLEMREYLPRG